jgi:hypothetical protein
MLWANPIIGRNSHESVPVPQGWQLELDSDVEIARSAFVRFMVEARQRQAQFALEAVIDHGIATHLPVGEKITEERLDGMIREIDATLEHMFCPDKTTGAKLVFPRTREQVLRRFGLVDSPARSGGTDELAED